MLMLLTVVVLLSCEFSVFANDVILKPLKTGKQVGIVFVQGTQYNPQQLVRGAVARSAGDIRVVRLGGDTTV